jgi:hypothetical protein
MNFVVLLYLCLLETSAGFEEIGRRIRNLREDGIVRFPIREIERVVLRGVWWQRRGGRHPV